MISARMLRLAGVLLLTGAALVGLNACSASEPAATAAPVTRAAVHDGICRVGPDGGPPADSAASGLNGRDADRGIGGTGVAAEVQAAIVTADRGIGGTGIIGVVTGFASICVDGLEVAYDATSAVNVDGAAADPSQVRVGAVVAIQAVGSPAAPTARSISVRIEAAGRIDSIEPSTGEAQVAGQRVLVLRDVPGAGQFGAGDWVMVSGLRRPDGVILASRVGAAPVNMLTARGPVRLEGGAPHLGALALPPGSATQGQWVHVAGTYTDGQPHAETVTADRFCPNLSRCFPVDHIVLEAFLRSEGSRLRIDGMLLPARGGAGHAGLNGIGIVSLERQPDGSYIAISARPIDRGVPGAGNAAAKSNTPPQDALQSSRPETIADRPSRGGSRDMDSTIAGLSGLAEPSQSDFDRTGSSASLTASLVTSIPTSTAAPATLPAPAAGPATPFTNQGSSQNPQISEPSSDATSRRRAVPMSSATPAHGRMTLISGSASQITTRTPDADSAGGSRKGAMTESIASPAGAPSVGTSSAGTLPDDATGGAHAVTTKLP